MLYPFMTLPDNTEIVHSEMKDGNVKVYIETPDEKDCFHHATCWLPAGTWEDIFGYTQKELAYLQELVESEKHMILEFAQTGGLGSAANF